MKRNIDLNEVSDGRLYTLNDMVKADCNDCEGCSACCRGMGKSVILDPMDVYQLTKGCKVDFQELLTRYIELNVVDGLILPNLKMDGSKEQCLFLDEAGRCSIHSFRPGICRLFPLARIYEDGEAKYFLQIHECTKTNRSKVKVKKWLGVPESNQYERFLLNWKAFLSELQDMMEEKQDAEVDKKINMLLLHIFFVKPYSMEEDFYPQFYQRVEGLKGLL